MIAGLPKLFDKIYFFFQSIRRSVVTKEELIQTLISQLDIVEKSKIILSKSKALSFFYVKLPLNKFVTTEEVEEQLRLLQELAPEWIYEKLAVSGDLLFWYDIHLPSLYHHFHTLYSNEQIHFRP